ncbi:MAG: hypothetical protein PHQ84_04205 [Candidatus Omnitrophica bacterium]|jgi:hypothetical protein|nr:hypothetical protein [Candidatus Omnitrophota bacterium]MDD3274227.1 hypothetical protein [Candidatus Omnitrophota bacterium]MDD5078190.1 hypothetical protein [Candidatus Omnitrophota bacterium]
MNIFVGNLAFEVNEEDLKKVFLSFGAVESASIVMEKKGVKSRGFGFVSMPDERAARAAIERLQGKEILGRPINVMPAVSKKHEGPAEIRPKKLELERTGRYKEGRRSISFLKKRSASAIPSDFKRRKHKSNPMRWRKKPRYGFSFNKPGKEGKEGAPYERPERSGGGRPEETRRGDFVKSGEGFKPWEKKPAGAKPWVKNTAEAKPWNKKLSGAKPWEKKPLEAKPWSKDNIESKPWKKKLAGGKPWEKRAPEPKPWKKLVKDRPWKKRLPEANPWKKGKGMRRKKDGRR